MRSYGLPNCCIHQRVRSFCITVGILVNSSTPPLDTSRHTTTPILRPGSTTSDRQCRRIASSESANRLLHLLNAVCLRSRTTSTLSVSRPPHTRRSSASSVALPALLPAFTSKVPTVLSPPCCLAHRRVLVLVLSIGVCPLACDLEKS